MNFEKFFKAVRNDLNNTLNSSIIASFLVASALI